MTERSYWLQSMLSLAKPVLAAVVDGSLPEKLQVSREPGQRGAFAHTEAVSRVLLGMAPWLEAPLPAGQERDQRDAMLQLAHAALAKLAEPGSAAEAEWHMGNQAVVDAGILSQALLRAPNALCGANAARRPDWLAPLVASMSATRKHAPWFNNWLLFAGILETLRAEIGMEFDRMRMDFAVRQIESWYCGDSFYRDGTAFHFDYYNSFVILPMMDDILRRLPEPRDLADLVEPVRQRLARHAVLLERMISPEGTYPPVGRSLAYRFGVFHALVHAVLAGLLPESLPAGQVRAALTAVMRRTLSAPGTFNAEGFLNIGIVGHQPAIGEFYISPASCYFCCAVFLPLGLGSDAAFWSEPAQPWTSQRLWNGEDLPADKAYAG